LDSVSLKYCFYCRIPIDLILQKETIMENIKEKIRTIPHFPKQGIMFRDITTLLKDAGGLKETIDALVKRYQETPIDLVAGIESRGFILAGAIAYLLGKGFVPIRKPGKLPAETYRVEYELEYGKDAIEMHKDAIKKGANVLMVDDLLATGGTMKAACEMVEKAGGKVVECAFVVNLPDLTGREKLKDYKVFALVEFEGE
jgi:adenine phosphoribosyltransferase